MLFLEARVAELEAKMSDVRRLCLNLHTSFEDTGILTACPSLLQPLQNDMLQLIAISEHSQSKNMAQLESAQTLDGDHMLDLSWDDAFFGPNELSTTASPVPSDEFTNPVFLGNDYHQISLKNVFDGDLGTRFGL